MKERVGLREAGQPLAAGAASPHVAHDRRIVTPFERWPFLKRLVLLAVVFFCFRTRPRNTTPGCNTRRRKAGLRPRRWWFRPRLTACITRIQPWAVAATALN